MNKKKLKKKITCLANNIIEQTSAEKEKVKQLEI
jgi:hypothetical protein